MDYRHGLLGTLVETIAQTVGASAVVFSAARKDDGATVLAEFPASAASVSAGDHANAAASP